MNGRIAVVGDSLSSGGTMNPYGGPLFLVHGHQAALIGGSAFCTACQSIGTIAKAGGPYRIKFQGEVALDDDIVLCGCSAPPRIVALLAGEAWCDDGLRRLRRHPERRSYRPVEQRHAHAFRRFVSSLPRWHRQRHQPS
ncbi:protein of unknown function [Burkholderia multivorans]